MAPIPYYFLWSPDYTIFSHILKMGIAAYPTLFEEKGIFVSQEAYNESMNKAPGHFLCGSYLKLEKTYELLCTLPEDSYFVFSDADILLIQDRPLEKLFRFYMDLQADLVFMREATTMAFYNVGFSLIRVNQKNRDLFKTALETAYKTVGGLDGTILNGCLTSYTGSVFFFPHECVLTSSTMIDVQKRPSNILEMSKSFMVFQALCDPTQSAKDRIMQKILQYKALGVPIELKN